MDEPSGRVCTKCGEWKPFSAFSHRGAGWLSCCKVCCGVEARAYYQANKRARAEYHAAYYLANKKRTKENADRWQAANLKRFRALQLKATRKRSARKRAVRAITGHHTEAEWRDLVLRSKGKCAVCGKRRRLTRDHIIPLSKEGGDEITNIQPLCQPCNSTKNTKRLHLL